MRYSLNLAYNALCNRENVYNRQPKMQANYSLFGKEFSFKDIDKTKFEQDKPRNKEILSNAYLARAEDLEGIEDSDIFDFLQQANEAEEVIDTNGTDKIIAKEFDLQTDKNYILKLSKNIPEKCIGVVVVAVGAHNTLLGAKKHYRELIQWNKEHPDKTMGMIFFDYRGAGLSDNIAPKDLNSDQEIINDVKAIIKYASTLNKPLCLFGTCFGTGPITGAVCQLSQECESDDDFQKKYNIKGILRSLEYSTFASVARKQQDYLGSFWHGVVATFGAPYRSATLTSLSNVHETAYIPANIPISTFQATRPRWTSSEPLNSVFEVVSDVKDFFGGIVESFFQKILLRPGDSMMGLEQAYKNWGIKHNPGRFIIDPTISHSEGVGFLKKFECLVDMFEYDCGNNQNYEGSIKKPSEIEPEVIELFSTQGEYEKKQEMSKIFSRYQELVQKTNQNNIDDCSLSEFEKTIYTTAICKQSAKLRDCLNKLLQEHKQEILTKLNCQEIFDDKNKLFDLETFESLVKELKEYQKHFGKCLRKRYIDEVDKPDEEGVQKVLTKKHTFYSEVEQEFANTDEKELWCKIYKDKEAKKTQCSIFMKELEDKYGQQDFCKWLIQQAQEIGIENPGNDAVDVVVGKISTKLTVQEKEANTDGMEIEYYNRQKDIKSLDIFLQSMQPANIQKAQLKLERDFSLTKPEEIERIKKETKSAIKYYRELYQLKAALNPEKYVLEQGLESFRKNKKDLQLFYKKILEQNIAYAIAGHFIAQEQINDNDDFQNVKNQFTEGLTYKNTVNIDFATVKTAHDKLRELKNQTPQPQQEKLYLKSSQGDLSPTGVHHQVDYGKHTPQEAFLKKVTDYDYMKQKVRKWDSKISSITPNSTTKPDDVTCSCSLFGGFRQD